jgi:hypothetical protein
MADLDSLTETEIEEDGKRFLLRSAPRLGASLARLHQLGVYGEANALKSLRGESKGRHYRG